MTKSHDFTCQHSTSFSHWYTITWNPQPSKMVFLINLQNTLIISLSFSSVSTYQNRKAHLPKRESTLTTIGNRKAHLPKQETGRHTYQNRMVTRLLRPLAYLWKARMQVNPIPMLWRTWGWGWGDGIHWYENIFISLVTSYNITRLPCPRIPSLWRAQTQGNPIQMSWKMWGDEWQLHIMKPL